MDRGRAPEDPLSFSSSSLKWSPLFVFVRRSVSNLRDAGSAGSEFLRLERSFGAGAGIGQIPARCIVSGMKKSATDVMEEIVFSAVIDAIGALKLASKGMPNTLLRDLGAVHQNTTLGDLPKELQAAIGESVRSAFGRLRKAGYTVANSDFAPPPSGAPNRPPRPGPRHAPSPTSRPRKPRPPR